MSEEALVVNHRDVSTWDETVDVLQQAVQGRRR